MATTQRHTKVSDRSTGRADYVFVGVDADGCEHVYQTFEENVVVIKNGERVWTQELDAENDIDAWIEHIEDRRGFETQYLFTSAAAAIGGAFE